MEKNEKIAVVLLLLSTFGVVFGIMGIEKIRRQKGFTLELIARAPEHGNWYPGTIKAPYMTEVKLLIRNIETVSHGFALPDFNISAGEIKAGEVKVVKFLADKKGRFPFMCTVWCSEKHMQMSGELLIGDGP